jgi:hypothetical protein
MFPVTVAVCLSVATVVCLAALRAARAEHRAAVVAWQKMNYMQDASPGLLLFQNMGTFAVPPLLMALRSQEWYARRKAAWALGQLGPLATNAVPDLIRALDDKDPALQMHAMNSLADIGIWRGDIVPALLDKLDDAEPGLWGCAARLLGVIERERVARELPPVSGGELAYALVFTRSHVPSIRVIGAHKLAQMPRDEQARRALNSLVNDSCAWVSQETRKLIGGMGVDQDPFLQFREDPFRQEAAIERAR